VSELSIQVSYELCMGVGECEHYAPGTFALGEDGLSKVVSADGDDEPTVLMAARSCPNFAITVSRDGQALL
jgi:ferredoxin